MLTTAGCNTFPPVTNNPSPLLPTFISITVSLLVRIAAVAGSDGGSGTAGFSMVSISPDKKQNSNILIKSFAQNKLFR